MEILICVGVAILIAVGIYLSVWISVKVSEKKSENERVLIGNLAKYDICKIKDFLNEVGKPIPNDGNNDYDTLENYYRAINSYVNDQINKQLQGYYKYKAFYNCNLYIRYNSEEVIIPSELLCNFNKMFFEVVHATESGITYYGTDKGIGGMTVVTLIDTLKKFEDRQFVLSNIDIVKWDDLIWYLDGVPDSSALAAAAAGATVGGLLLGPVGAVAGALSADKRNNEKVNDIRSRCRLVFGYKRPGGKKWTISTGMDSKSFESNFEFFNETCPNIRGRDILRQQ